MKQNDIRALQEKTVAELQAQVTEVSKELARARLEKKAGRRQNTHIAMIADDLARVKTVIRKKELETA